MLSRAFLKRFLRPIKLGARTMSSEAAIPAAPHTTNDGIPKAADFDDEKYFEVNDKTGIIVTLEDHRGSLNKALSVFDKYKVSLTHIESKPSKYHKESKAYDFYLDFMGTLEDESVRNVIGDLSRIAEHLTICGTPNVPWFPTNFYDLDKIGKETLSEGDGIQEADHPGFRDEEYKKRRNYITDLALKYNMYDKEVPRVKYTDQEVGVWQHCYPKLKEHYKTRAVKEFNKTLADFETHCGFAEDNIPQLEDISVYLQDQTGWRIRPVGGLLSQREFLNGLAFKVFHSTQYIRHHSNPEYTPEPDIIHELMGHAPMFANQDYADLSQMIGLASLGCPDMYLPRLGTLYWFTIEFGLCMEDNERKAYGAGILSSFGELDWCFSKGEKAPKFYNLECEEIAENHRDFPISSVQPYYFVSESWADARNKIREYCEAIPRPFNVFYNEDTQSIEVDRKIKGVFQKEEDELLF